MQINSSEIKYQKRYGQYKDKIDSGLKIFAGNLLPKTVYEPIDYVLSGGGKRLRAILVILACEAVGGKSGDAMAAAIAIEVLHNFTLVHDDVMDHADLRRGKPTVHKKWDANTAILSGDEMIAQAYRILLKTKSNNLKSVLDVYTDALVQVCEGQGFDKEFESRYDVSLKEYYKMISKKTGRVISAATQIGAILGGGTSSQENMLKNFGNYLGRAFQIQDDLLDVTGTTEKFGKNIGGDIHEGKKTYLLLKAFKKANPDEKKILNSIFPEKRKTSKEIKIIKNIYHKTGAIRSAEEEVFRNTIKAQNSISMLPSSHAKLMLLWFSGQLLNRTS